MFFDLYSKLIVLFFGIFIFCDTFAYLLTMKEFNIQTNVYSYCTIFSCDNSMAKRKHDSTDVDWFVSRCRLLNSYDNHTVLKLLRHESNNIILIGFRIMLLYRVGL